MIVLVSVVLAVWVVLLYGFYWAGYFIELADPLDRVDAVLIPGGDADFHRTAKGVQLYHRGYVSYLVLTGCRRRHGEDNPFVLKKRAMAMGVPEDAIILVTGSASTYEDMAQARDLIASHRFRKILLVTSPYHQLRASLLLKKQLRGTEVEILNQPAFDPEWVPGHWWEDAEMRRLVIREHGKLIGAWLLGWIGPLPELYSPPAHCDDY